MYNGVTLLYSKKLTQHCNSTILQLKKKKKTSKNKIVSPPQYQRAHQVPKSWFLMPFSNQGNQGSCWFQN